MDRAQTLHHISICAPHYSGDARTSLHRYLSTEFISRFEQDVQRQQFNLPQFSAWLEEERHSKHDKKPVLRLPLHRAFHVMCCEVVCERFGHPALDSQRITSAGFVVRRVGGAQEQAWILEDGEAVGWQAAPTELRDPDVRRRLCANGVLHKRGSEPAYSGEEVHPLHVLNSVDAKGKRHTLLYGFVPLGGFYYFRDSAGAFDASEQKNVDDAAAAMLPWPFGFRAPLDQTWTVAHACPVDQGRSTKAMFELLRMLVNRYHLGEVGVAGNAALQAWTENIWFYDVPVELRGQIYSDANRVLFKPYQRDSLWQYLSDCFAQGGSNPLVNWLVRQEQAADDMGGLDKLAQLELLPASSGSGSLSDSLFMVDADAQELRELLGQRLRDQVLAQVREIPLPKFGAAVNDVFQILPFVRSLNDQGREQIQWADTSARSLAFRVAAPFDPEASRPSLIQIPSLADLKRGLAKGASMITPGDTFDIVNKLKFSKGVSPDALPSDSQGGLGIQWICSFSLPVITLVAMILLMIMISLLNIIFFWMPWVKICLPFPKLKKD